MKYLILAVMLFTGNTALGQSPKAKESKFYKPMTTKYKKIKRASPLGEPFTAIKDVYSDKLHSIDKRFKISTKEGFLSAKTEQGQCLVYISGLIDGQLTVGNKKLYKSTKHQSWIATNANIKLKMLRAEKTKDYRQAYYYARSLYLLNCGYQKDLKLKVSRSVRLKHKKTKLNR